MTIAQRLAALRQLEDGCRLAAFGDIGAGIVLRTSCETGYPQEFLDELCQQAERGFSLLDALPDEDSEQVPDHMLVLSPEDARVYVRAPDGSGDAVLCVCGSADAATRLAEPARQLLASAGGEV